MKKIALVTLYRQKRELGHLGLVGRWGTLYTTEQQRKIHY